MIGRMLSAMRSKLTLGLLAVLVTLVSISMARLITHTHEIGDTVYSTSLDIIGKWQLRVQAPTIGYISGTFISPDRTQWCGGVERIYDGQTKCGQACPNLPSSWNFETAAHVTQGVAYGWAWVNEPAPPSCSNPTPHDPGSE